MAANPASFAKRQASKGVRQLIRSYLRRFIGTSIALGLLSGWGVANNIQTIGVAGMAKSLHQRTSICTASPVGCSIRFLFDGKPGTAIERLAVQQLNQGVPLESVVANLPTIPLDRITEHIANLPTPSPPSQAAQGGAPDTGGGWGWLPSLPEPPQLPNQPTPPASTPPPAAGGQIVPKGETWTLPRKDELLANIDQLPTGEPNGAGYVRAEWHPDWAKRPGDQCTSRVRELIDAAQQIEINGCTIQSGVWQDPYTDTPFVASTRKELRHYDIDHMVPLSYAAKHGGATWTPEQRHTFGNDTLNLWPVIGVENSLKKDKGPSQYIPKAQNVACAYAATWDMVVRKYGLYIEPADQEALRTLAQSCPA